VGGGQGGVNKGVPVTAGFFFVGGIVEFDDQYRAEFVACAQDEINVLGLDAIEVRLPVGCSLRHVNEVGESDFGEHDEKAIYYFATTLRYVRARRHHRVFRERARASPKIAGSQHRRMALRQPSQTYRHEPLLRQIQRRQQGQLR